MVCIGASPVLHSVFWCLWPLCCVQRPGFFDTKMQLRRTHFRPVKIKIYFQLQLTPPTPPHCLLMKLLCCKFSRHARSEWRNACLCNSLPGYYEASRTKPLPSLLLFLGSPPTITHRNRKKGIDHERDGWKTSVTFITFHVLHYAVNAEQWVQKDVSGREMGLSRHFVTSQAVWE